ncbi:hypothetical protein SAMN04489740_1090 [Arthrobacter alpinus]|uniref:Uncharacterized protein n=1 Tax=Arthrobacter alpinus TaxID=656366 RepID=A0A1H5HS91_9MICC|nr:hypothetical protein SAMN04489740_1090 [Arthrobacter alpinus]
MSTKEFADGKSIGEEPDDHEGVETAPQSGSRDVESDPALNDGLGQDWSDEGGATPSGPATSSN